MHNKRGFILAWIVVLLVSMGSSPVRAAADNPAMPASPVKLIFIHHSTGQNWLEHSLGARLRDNNYFVSDTNYGWGPGGIGSYTDIGHWYTWFRSASAGSYTSALYTEFNPHSSYPRLSDPDPARQNEIILFKSCFPNSDLQGSPTDPVPPIGSNPLRGEGVGGNHTVANAKGIYLDLLEYFRTRQDKLFVLIVSPPLYASDHGSNARYLSNWLVNDWLDGYPYQNVAVFDFYNVLTSNGGNINTSDHASASGNHHRWWNGAVQHQVGTAYNLLAYPSPGGDSHPNAAGNLKATEEFVPLLNVFYHRWKASQAGLTLLFPNGTAALPPATPIQVRWSSTGEINQVNLAYSTDGFVHSTVIASGITNSGAYPWTTPASLLTGLQVRVSDASNPAMNDYSDAPFALVEMPERIRLPEIFRFFTNP